MLRHYSRCILLIESNEKFKHRKVNGGPFQGELSRRSRETRSLLTMLIRANPKMTAIWSSSPSCSAELFEEIKVCLHSFHFMRLIIIPIVARSTKP